MAPNNFLRFHSLRGRSIGTLFYGFIDLPVISELLECLIGNPNLLKARKEKYAVPLPTFRLDHINVHTHAQKGFEGGRCTADGTARRIISI